MNSSLPAAGSTILLQSETETRQQEERKSKLQEIIVFRTYIKQALAGFVVHSWLAGRTIFISREVGLPQFSNLYKRAVQIRSLPFAGALP